MKHTFVICAYKESEFLEECILSLKNQSISSEIFIATSTPNKYIEALAEKYGIEIFINNGQKGITQDWNFGLSKVRTRYATVAHQDDVYEPDYAEKIINVMEKHKNSIIAFSFISFIVFSKFPSSLKAGMITSFFIVFSSFCFFLISTSL